MDTELRHYGVKGMRWGVRRKLRKSDAFQKTRKDVKSSHRKYWKAETEYQDAIRKSGNDFEKKRPYNPNASESETLGWEVDRYTHVLNKSHAAKQQRDAATRQYRQTLDNAAKQYGDMLVRDIKVSEKQRQKIDRIIREELRKDIWSED